MSRRAVSGAAFLAAVVLLSGGVLLFSITSFAAQEASGVSADFPQIVRVNVADDLGGHAGVIAMPDPLTVRVQIAGVKISITGDSPWVDVAGTFQDDQIVASGNGVVAGLKGIAVEFDGKLIDGQLHGQYEMGTNGGLLDQEGQPGGPSITYSLKPNVVPTTSMPSPTPTEPEPFVRHPKPRRKAGCTGSVGYSNRILINGFGEIAMQMKGFLVPAPFSFPAGESVQTRDWVQVEFFGDSPVGFVHAYLNERWRSTAQMTSIPMTAGATTSGVPAPFFPARHENTLYMMLELPDVGLTLFNKEPVITFATIPAFPPRGVDYGMEVPLDFYNVDDPDGPPVATILEATIDTNGEEDLICSLESTLEAAPGSAHFVGTIFPVDPSTETRLVYFPRPNLGLANCTPSYAEVLLSDAPVEVEITCDRGVIQDGEIGIEDLELVVTTIGGDGRFCRPIAVAPSGVAQTPAPTATATPTPTLTPTPTKAVGDVDDNGVVNSIDASLVLQLVVGLIDSLTNPASADTNVDGDVTSVDATLILQFSAGLLDGLPP